MVTVEGNQRPFKKFNVFDEFFVHFGVRALFDHGIVVTTDIDDLGVFFALREEINFLLESMIKTGETVTHADRPRHWVTVQPKGAFDIVDQLEWLFTFAVHLVSESKNRNL